MSKKEGLFAINPSWRIMLFMMKINQESLLKWAKLPLNLFSKKNSGITTDEYFRLWQGMEFLSGNASFPLVAIEHFGSEVFDPPVFAAYCSPNMATALERLKQFKPICGPMTLDLESTTDKTQLFIRFNQERVNVPLSLLAMELLFFVQLVRLATKETIIPLAITIPKVLPEFSTYIEFFGVEPTLSNEISITFSNDDLQKPFITENTLMWEFFEPGLRKRLLELQPSDDIKERVRSVILEMLPSGQTTVTALADRLNTSPRTIQRHLGEQGTNYKNLLSEIREELARYYIVNSDLPYTQISFLLGYEDPNSFFRAFQTWTGSTPDSVRLQNLIQH